ncbi:hypothetical protein Emag_002299 [Eimeria magna]
MESEARGSRPSDGGAVAVTTAAKLENSSFSDVPYEDTSARSQQSKRESSGRSTAAKVGAAMCLFLVLFALTRAKQTLTHPEEPEPLCGDVVDGAGCLPNPFARRRASSEQTTTSKGDVSPNNNPVPPHAKKDSKKSNPLRSPYAPPSEAAQPDPSSDLTVGTQGQQQKKRGNPVFQNTDYMEELQKKLNERNSAKGQPSPLPTKPLQIPSKSPSLSTNSNNPQESSSSAEPPALEESKGIALVPPPPPLPPSYILALPVAPNDNHPKKTPNQRPSFSTFKPVDVTEVAEGKDDLHATQNLGEDGVFAAEPKKGVSKRRSHPGNLKNQGSFPSPSNQSPALATAKRYIPMKPDDETNFLILSELEAKIKKRRENMGDEVDGVSTFNGGKEEERRGGRDD